MFQDVYDTLYFSLLMEQLKRCKPKENLKEQSEQNTENQYDKESDIYQLQENFDNEKQKLILEHEAEIMHNSSKIQEQLLELKEKLGEKNKVIEQLEKNNSYNLKLSTERESESEINIKEGMWEEERKELSDTIISLQENLNEKDKELDGIRVQGKDDQATLEAQMQHLIEGYETKLEDLRQQYNADKENHKIQTEDWKREIEDKSIMINHLKRDLEKISLDIKSQLNSGNAKYETELSIKNSKITDLESKYEYIELKHDESIKLIHQLECEKETAHNEIVQLQEHISAKDETVANVTKELQNKLRINQELEKKLFVLENEKQTSNENLIKKLEEEKFVEQQRLNKEIRELKESIRQVSEELSIRASMCLKLEKDLKTVKENIPMIETKSRQKEYELREELLQQKEDLENKDRRLVKLQADQTFLEEKVEKGEAKLRVKEDELERARTALDQSEARVRRIEEFVTDQKERVRELELRLQHTDKVILMGCFSI